MEFEDDPRIRNQCKGPSINDVTPKGEKGGYPKKVTRGDKGRDPIFSRGDVTKKFKNSPF